MLGNYFGSCEKYFLTFSGISKYNTYSNRRLYLEYAASPFLLSGVMSGGVSFGDWLGNRSLGGQWVEHGWGFHTYLRRYDRVGSRFHSTVGWAVRSLRHLI